MADGNTAAPAGGVGDAADFVGVETGGVEREVEVEVDVEVEPAGEVEDAGDLGVGVAVDIGGAADEVAAGFEGGGEHVLAAGIVEEAFLGEGAEFEVDGPGVVALEALQGADAGQADAGVDLDMGADAGGALQDGALEGAAGAGVDVVLGEVALGGGDGGDGVGQRALAWAAIEDGGFVEVDVGLDEAGADEAVVCVEGGGVGGELADLGDPALDDADADGVGSVGQAGIADDVVEHGDSVGVRPAGREGLRRSGAAASH